MADQDNVPARGPVAAQLMLNRQIINTLESYRLIILSLVATHPRPEELAAHYTAKVSQATENVGTDEELCKMLMREEAQVRKWANKL